MILAAHRDLADVARIDRLQRAQHAQLLVTHRVGIHRVRRLHRDDRQQLQQVVLHHVAQRARIVVEIAARLDAELFRDRDLDALDPFAAPQWLEQRVAEAQREQVLYRLLAEVVVDPVDLAFREDLADRVVDRVRRLQVVAERFLEHDARAFVQADRRERLADRHEQRRAGREIEHADAGQRCDRVAQHDVVLRTAEIELHVFDALEKRLPCRVVERVAGRLRRMRLHVRIDPFEIACPIRFVPRDGHDPAAVRQHVRAVRFEQRGQDLAHRQIAGAAEKYEGKAGIGMHVSPPCWGCWEAIRSAIKIFLTLNCSLTTIRRKG